MKFANLVKDWQKFIISKSPSSNISEYTLDNTNKLLWIFPEITFLVENKEYNFGSIYSYTESELATEGFLANQGFIAIGSSTCGSVLIMKISGNDLGSCKWLAPGFKDRSASDFHKITSEFLGSPTHVFNEMIKTIESGLDYFKDSDFDDDYWAGNL